MSHLFIFWNLSVTGFNIKHNALLLLLLLLLALQPLILNSSKIVLKHPASNFRSSSTEQYLWGGLSAPVQPPTWRTRVSLFVWVITFDLFGMGGPTSSYATASIAPRITRPRKSHHYIQVGDGGLNIVVRENVQQHQE